MSNTKYPFTIPPKCHTRWPWNTAKIASNVGFTPDSAFIKGTCPKIYRELYVHFKKIVRGIIQHTVLLIKFLPSLPVTAERGSTPSVPYPPLRAASGIATCSVVGDTYRPVAKLSPAWGWWTLPCLACLLSPHPNSSGQTITWVAEHSDQRLSVREYLIKDQI